MNNRIEYLNTDLDVWSELDLTKLATCLGIYGVNALHVTRLDDGTWYATFETDDCYKEPEETISALLTAIEALPKDEHDIWVKCSRCEFNVGYDCGEEPWEFNQGLSHGLLGRLAQVGGSLRVTLYPDRTPT